jgi:hypothetical protein
MPWLTFDLAQSIAAARASLFSHSGGSEKILRTNTEKLKTG